MTVSPKTSPSWITSIVDLSALMLTFFAATLAMSDLPGQVPNSGNPPYVLLEKNFLQSDLLAVAPELDAPGEPRPVRPSAYLSSTFATAIAEALDDRLFAWRQSADGSVSISNRTGANRQNDANIADNLLPMANRIRQVIPARVELRFEQDKLASTSFAKTYSDIVGQLQAGDEILFSNANYRMKLSPK